MVTIKEPESMEEVLYFTFRIMDGKPVKAWAYKKECPSCGKAKMGKPINPKTGKVKSRAKEYVCPLCDFTEEKVEHEESLILESKYTCPTCEKDGASTTPFKRKTIDGVPTFRVECSECGANIDITKKMKAKKEKKKKVKK